MYTYMIYTSMRTFVKHTCIIDSGEDNKFYLMYVVYGASVSNSSSSISIVSLPLTGCFTLLVDFIY